MDIWVTYCRRRSKCRYCEEYILAGKPILVGKIWKQAGTTDVKRRFCVTLRWHPSCWLEQAMQRLDKVEYIPRKGRPLLQMSEEDKASRFAILRRRAAILQRIRVETAKPEQNIDRIIHLGAMLADLKEEIKPYGGAPKSW
jgi:hypothetical protein